MNKPVARWLVDEEATERERIKLPEKIRKR